jgi:hypothetical protein
MVVNTSEECRLLRYFMEASLLWVRSDRSNTSLQLLWLLFFVPRCQKNEGSAVACRAVRLDSDTEFLRLGEKEYNNKWVSSKSGAALLVGKG